MTRTLRLPRALLPLAAVCILGVAFRLEAQDKDAAGAGALPYKVVDGFMVDPNTMNGFRAWRAAACDRCHGANQQGLVGPSLIESFKTLSKEDFVKTVTEGRLEKGMPSFKTSTMVMENTDGLYAYLKGRSNGDITRAHVQELKP
jgi:mono/diheme cytochrome c family protein